ncbi:response regulator [Corynebacterium gallinarum]|uniref:Response regulator transcription factor n=1 Tax=Corynebacterium gallinarum TaxID=2762214 RepID=A0A8I0HNI1_9CORY|nr:response regulator transcription factor [Corynebacterium gallinarum]MBD8029197.1 response regulator transcription factor [Corynebacterium gallinarum]
MTHRILIVDDDPIILRNLPVFFTMAEDLTVVGTAASGRDALAFMEHTSCNVILSDLSMPGMSGIELLSAVKELDNPPIFIAMTGFDTDRAMLGVLSAGSAGYIAKSDPPESVIWAVREAIKGGTALSAASTSRLVDATIRRGVPPRPREFSVELSRGERETLDLLCQGLTNAQIARKLHYSEAAVKKQVSAMLRKFEVDSRVALAVKALGTSQNWN